MNSDHAVAALLAVMARLRDPAHGCAWDRRQDAHSLAPYTLEEAYEVVDAIARGDAQGLRDELGDLLLQVVFHAQIAQEGGAFDFVAVVRTLTEKLVRRHPHVFAGEPAQDDAARSAQWEAQKAAERAARGRAASVLSDVPLALPALMRAQKLQRRAATMGLDWPGPDGVLDKLREELAELALARAGQDLEAITAELGDVLFTAVNLARHLQVDSEAALRGANGRFEARVRALEALLAAQGRSAGECDAQALDTLWQTVKQARTVGSAGTGSRVPSAKPAAQQHRDGEDG